MAPKHRVLNIGVEKFKNCQTRSVWVKIPFLHLTFLSSVHRLSVEDEIKIQELCNINIDRHVKKYKIYAIYNNTTNTIRAF
jgi:hypothetical protein